MPLYKLCIKHKFRKEKINSLRKRRNELLKSCKKNGGNTLVAFEPENLYYMTGFWGEAIGILKKNGTTILAPQLEAGRAKEESIDCKIISSERGDQILSTLISKLTGTKVCTDCKDPFTIQLLKKSISGVKQTSTPFYDARIIKDSQEISILKKASKIIDEMFDLCTKTIKKGMQESELQAILMAYAMENQMFDTGYKSTLNPLIIAGGPNGALPHAQVTKRKFVSGDLIVVDLTLRYKGYVTDATRTFGLGKVSEKAKQVYDIVKESQKLGLKKAKPGVYCKEVDYACRKYIQEHEYGKYFIHSTGHGIGLEVHELPNINQKSKTKLKKNMAITVEPGIYIPKKFGVRIEDSLIVKEKPLLLHKFTKDLIII